MKLLETSNKGLCSLEIMPDGVAFAYAPNPDDSEITVCDFESYQAASQPNLNYITNYLTKIVSQYCLRKTKCNWVLHPDYYRLTLIDTPNVPQAEYKQAARWQIKDIISYPLEDVAIDIFYPDEPTRSLKKIYVIAAQNSFLQNIANIIQDCGLILTSVDIREFAIRNLITKLAKSDESLGFLSVIKNRCLIVLIKQSNIQFVRYMPVNLKSDGNYEELVTEIQRSFSYCQTELGIEIPNNFLMPPKEYLEKNTMQHIAEFLAKFLNKKLGTFDLGGLVNFNNLTINQQIEANCWVAIGGALRNLRLE